MRIILSIIYLILLTSPALALDVNNVRFGKHPDKIRIVIEVSQQTDFKAFALPKIDNKPYRLVLDLPSFDWKAANISQQKGIPITDVRTSSANEGPMRIAFDLSHPTILQDAFTIPAQGNKPNRIVLDLKAVSEDLFNQTERKEFGSLKTENKNNNKNLDDIIAHNTLNTKTNINTNPPSQPGTPVPIRKPSTTTTKQKFNTPTTPLYRPLIVIDPGHGGPDPGAIGVNKTYEKNVALAAAKRLKAHLEQENRYRVSLTRADDRYIKLYKRVSIARAQEADLFISIHADSIDNPRIRGASVYTLSNRASDAQTAKLAARENQADLIAGVDLSHEDKEVANILLDLAMRDTMNQSKFFANIFVDKMKKYGIRTLDRPHRYAGFAVLKAPDIPSVLIEIGFMSNRSEVKLITTRAHQDKISKAIKSSADAYFSKVQNNSR